MKQKTITIRGNYEGKIKVALKPCPFCGNMPKITQQFAPTYALCKPFLGMESFIQCESSKCFFHPHTGITTKGRDNKSREKAIRILVRKWNKRK